MGDTNVTENAVVQQRARELRRVLDTLFGQLAEHETDPLFGYRVYVIKGEAQARIFRLERQLSTAANESAPPTEGRYVSATVTLLRGRFLLAFAEFPKDGDESIHHDMLEYDEREYDKVPQHIVQYLTTGIVPEVDDEYPYLAPFTTHQVVFHPDEVLTPCERDTLEEELRNKRQVGKPN